MLKPTQEQRWDAVEGFRPALADPRAQWELRAWAILAVGALAIAGIFALLLVMGRVMHADDIYPWLVAYFDKFLIVHVNFSFIVWFLIAGMIFMQVGAYRLTEGETLLGRAGRMSVVVCATGMLLIAGAALTDGEPSKNNYVPAIIHSYFYFGLLALAFSTMTIGVRTAFAYNVRKGPIEPVGVAGLASCFISLAAVAAFASSWGDAGGMPTSVALNEDVFWAGGHILQFLNVAVMVGAWTILGGRALGEPVVPPKIAIFGSILLMTSAAGGYAILFVSEPMSVHQRDLFTQYQYALAPVPVVIGLLALRNLLAKPVASGPFARLAKITVLTSIVVFFTGGILGIFVDGADTRTPAHYHGVIGGVNVALMGFFYQFVLPLLGRGLVRTRGATLSVVLYGAGQFLHSIGLFITGGYGAPRKVAGAVDLDILGNWIGHAGIGIGGVIAVIGGILFIWIAGRRLLQRVN